MSNNWKEKRKKRASSDDKIVLQPKFNKSNELFFRKQTNICDYGRNTSELRKSYSDIVFIVFLFFFSFYFLLQQTNGTKIMSIIIEFYINYFYIWSNLLHLLDDNVKELTTLILRFVSTSSLASLLYLMRFGCVTTTPYRATIIEAERDNEMRLMKTASLSNSCRWFFQPMVWLRCIRKYHKYIINYLETG